MAVVRNCADIGINLQNIMKRLMANEDLCKYLYYTDKDPLNHPNVPDKNTNIFEKLIKIVPRVGPKETAHSLIVIRVAKGPINPENGEFKDLVINVEIFTPMTEWMVKSTNLRPFLLMGEVEKSLKGKKVEGLGRMEYQGFQLNFNTEEITCYEMAFKIVTFD